MTKIKSEHLLASELDEGQREIPDIPAAAAGEKTGAEMGAASRYRALPIATGARDPAKTLARGNCHRPRGFCGCSHSCRPPLPSGLVRHYQTAA